MITYSPPSPWVKEQVCLGLAIAQQQFVERHGGTLKVDSVVGQGTEFTIMLPVAVKTH
ncbi:ATP-binding protein [Nostoc sp. UIC 10607]|uniref:ATP-binding protein n=1 Tax=Nostoc sp. UIC 10607 TaxID=3045935 RepID=UPI00399F77DE